MKALGAWLIVTAFGAIPGAAFASKCAHASEVTKSETHQINVRNNRIHFLARESADDQRRISDVQAKLDIWNHTMKVHDTKISSIREAVVAIQEVGGYLEGTVSTDLSLKLILDHIRNSQSLTPDRRLADQLRLIARNNDMRADLRESLERFAKTVNLLERMHAEFAAAEAKLIEDYLNGRNTLVDGMLDTLNHLGQRLNAELAQANFVRNQDQVTAGDLAKQVADAKARRVAGTRETQSLHQANAASAATLAEWNVDKHCTIDPMPGFADSVKF